jgi:hypothetical protein
MSESRQYEAVEGIVRTEAQKLEAELDCAERLLATARKEELELGQRIERLRLEIERAKEEFDQMLEVERKSNEKKSFLSRILSRGE